MIVVVIGLFIGWFFMGVMEGGDEMRPDREA
jgi:hypothetical protein